jgi:hypothetical protein
MFGHALMASVVRTSAVRTAVEGMVVLIVP